jgi:bifunctional isochorismate lyase/aryl carrier protein
MKEVYFTSVTLEQKALELCLPFEHSRRHRFERFSPLHSALLVLDMQLYFVEPTSHAWVPSAAAILPGIQSLIQAYQVLGLPVIFTRHVNTPANAGQMSYWWRELLTADNPLSQLIPALDISNNTVILKSQYDAFYGTALVESLHAPQLVICGLMTHLCCETTARSAFMHGFEVFFCVDGTATYHQDFHRASLLNLSHGFATLVLVKEMLDRLREIRA